MASMFRSEPMMQCDIYLRPECAYDVLSELGELGVVQFQDMNPDLNAFQRKYVSDVMRCAEVERKLRYIELEMKKEDISIFEPMTFPPAPPKGEILVLENTSEKWQSEIEQMTDNNVDIKNKHKEILEMYHVLVHVGAILGDTEENKIVQNTLGEGGKLCILSGLIRRSKCFSFETMLWRMSRGNIYYRQASKDETIVDPKTGQGERKVAFVIICQGEHLQNLMTKVCKGFRANLYQCPHSFEERERLIAKLSERLQDFEEVLLKTKILLLNALKTIAKQHMIWEISIKKMKAIYHTMNLFNVDVTKNVLIGRCWVPIGDTDKVRHVLDKCTDVSREFKSFMSRVATDSEPPTYFRTNKFTNGFQALINAYGIATYREVNPGMFTVISFPFLFALMFGDIGHASIVFLFALWMILYEKSLEPGSKKNEVWGIFFGGRYILLLMGVFSIFTGFIYNDVFSKAMNIFGSHWRNVYDEYTLRKFYDFSLDPRDTINDRTYLMGLDPAWALSSNKIMFENSLKMKFSIIIGVVHMLFGIILSVYNYTYFKKRYSIVLEFVPQVLFLALLFMYLVLLIFLKWFLYSGNTIDPKSHSSCAPLVLLLFIDMMLFSKSTPVEEWCDAYMYPGQRAIQTTLVLIALSCIPVMLLGKPLYLHYSKGKQPVVTGKPTKFRSYQKRDSNEMPLEPVDTKVEEETRFSDLMINQAVHTIEYVLSTISHTASYLRLWALSLAHSQLSHMLWDMILSKNGLQIYDITGCIPLVISFALWAIFSLAILVIMEGLSAFLHTLRLHWVEFMSKFYIGTGYPFQPFCFNDLFEPKY